MKNKTAIRIAPPAPDKVNRGRAPTSTQVLTPAGQATALQLRGQDDNSRWQVGDLSLAEIAKRAGQVVMVDDERHVITIDEVRRAIGDVAGMESSTVRAREETAEYWPKNDRKDFYDTPLTYSYFRAAMYAETKAAARAHLYRALESADDYGGMIMPVRVLRMQVKAQRRAALGLADNAGDTPPGGTPRDSILAVGTAIRELSERPDMPAPVAGILRAAAEMIGTALDWFGESTNA